MTVMSSEAFDDQAPAWFQWAWYPALIAGSMGATYWLMGQGVHAGLAVVQVFLGSLVLLALLERVYPRYVGWNRSRGDIRVDGIHYVVSAALGSVVVSNALLTSAMVVLGGWLSAQLGVGLWPSGWPILAQVALGLIVVEFAGYWLHRLTHEYDILWRFHAIHHSAPRLYWLNATRNHPIDSIILGVGQKLMIVPLGPPTEVFALLGVVAAVHGFSQHTNLQQRCGPLNWIFATAELHRWHHSQTLREANSNYGQTLIIWDILFGTRYLPDRAPPEAVGIGDLPGFPVTYWGHLLAPFRWRRVQAESGHQPGHV